MTKTRAIKISLITFSVIFTTITITVLSIINYFLPYSSIRPVRLTHNKIVKIFYKHEKPSNYNLKYDKFTLNVDKGITLKGWFIHSQSDIPKGTIIMMHGIATSKESLLLMADSLATHGYNCLPFDSRAHGESGGVNCTFGYYEKNDVSKIISAIIKKYPDSPPFGIYGCSLGAAIGIQAMALDKRIKSAVVESPFASLKETVDHYWYNMSGLRINYIPDEALKRSERIARFWVDSVMPEKSAYMIHNPVMVVYAEHDKNIPVTQSFRVFRNIKSQDKKLYEVKGADHNSIVKFGGHKYFKDVIDYFDRNLNP
ncbi:MAG: alpha/beta fold hydrolase [Ignavibacteriae bacterium]|nr:alpha/beta fold hydrolase [Ignavibacteriota bacterium]